MLRPCACRALLLCRADVTVPVHMDEDRKIRPGRVCSYLKPQHDSLLLYEYACNMQQFGQLSLQPVSSSCAYWTLDQSATEGASIWCLGQWRATPPMA